MFSLVPQTPIRARAREDAHQANGIAYGKQNPLTSSELYTVCVLPVCLYGSESWVLTEMMIDTIEHFQGDLWKKILNIPKHHSNLIPLVALRWPTMRLRILLQKAWVPLVYPSPKEKVYMLKGLSRCSKRY